MSEVKYGLVLDTSFIGGGLQPAGRVLPNYAGPYGEAIKPCDADGNLLESDAPESGEVKDAVKLFAAKHVGGGSYAVERIEDGSRASVVFKNTGTKGEAEAQAEAEADRLNQGGEIKLAEPENTPPPPADDDLPDA